MTFIDFEGQGHSFFNFNVDIHLFESTINSTDDFLVERGYIEPLEGGSTTRLI
jgi:hypothetical protein